tara:strand:- start:53 stop:388 length:336 start_codon:yes stop_codon:yes gene_type:complete
MQPIHATNMIVGKEYYIKSKSYPLSRQIARCRGIRHIKDDMYVVDFYNIQEIKEREIGSGLHFGEGYRHCYWFEFYPTYKQVYQQKLDALYNNVTNKYLQTIMGDPYFTWY